MGRPSIYLFATALCAATPSVIIPSVARADVTSWLALGGGYAQERNRTAGTRDRSATLTYSLGVGTTPLAPFVVGGLLRGVTYLGFDSGSDTDFGLALRVCTGGFARGDWGLALDAGVTARPFNSAYGEWPIQAVLTGGAPWGFQLALGADVWSASGGVPAQGLFAALEIDLLRLTVMRQGGTEQWWPNPVPAGGHLASSTPVAP